METIQNQSVFLILLCLSFVLIGVLSGLVVYLLLKQKDGKGEQGLSKGQKDDLSLDLHEVTTCHLHEKEPARGVCCICDKSLCEPCIKEYDGLSFCHDHLKTFSENKWVDITNVKTTPNNPEAANFLYQFKKQEWFENSIPTYIITHYKINLDGDHIESYVMLYVRSQDEDNLKNKLNRIN